MPDKTEKKLESGSFEYHRMQKGCQWQAFCIGVQLESF